MKIPSDKITCENPMQINRLTQTCDYMYERLFLFHERSYFPWSPFNKSTHSQWFCQFSLTKKECDKVVKPYGKSAYSCAYFYSEGAYFPCFRDNDKAVEFCNSKEFEQLSKTLEKTKE